MVKFKIRLDNGSIKECNLPKEQESVIKGLLGEYALNDQEKIRNIVDLKREGITLDFLNQPEAQTQQPPVITQRFYPDLHILENKGALHYHNEGRP